MWIGSLTCNPVALPLALPSIDLPKWLSGPMFDDIPERMAACVDRKSTMVAIKPYKGTVSSLGAAVVERRCRKTDRRRNARRGSRAVVTPSCLPHL